MKPDFKKEILVIMIPEDQGSMCLAGMVKPGYKLISIIRKNTKATLTMVKEEKP